MSSTRPEPQYTLTETHHYLGHLMQRADSLEKNPDAGKTEGQRRRGQQRIRWLESITDSMDMHVSKLQEIVKAGKPGMLQSRWVTKSQSRLGNWKTTWVQALPTIQSLPSGTHVIAISGLWAGTWDIRVVTEVYVLAFTQPLLPRKGLHYWPVSIFLYLLGSQCRCDQQFLHFGIHSTNNYWDSSLDEVQC